MLVALEATWTTASSFDDNEPEESCRTNPFSKCTKAGDLGGAKSALLRGIECSPVDVEGEFVMMVLPG
jgi:hypothetical protein